ncbi:hypothetical protein HKX48_006773 [Thoreauomyces humboldtii]|nr:hypothetical protein HKX48_006773 [Thoreauomyces humboldtii]
MKISLESAQLGFHYWSTEYDFHRKEHKRVRKVRWEHRDFGRHPVSSARLDGTELYSQIYASYRFKKEYVDGVRGAEVWSEAKPFREAQLPENVVADPFQMNSRVAWDRVIAAFQVQEELRLEGALKSETSCDEVRGLRLSIEATPVEGKKVLALPVFVSTYVFTATYRGTTFRTFVNGTSGAIGGQRIPAPERVGLLVGGAASLVAVLTGAFSSAGFFLLWFAVPFTIAMFAARFWPLIWAAIYEARRRGAEALEAEANSTPGGGPRAGRHYGPGEYQQEQQRQQQQQQQRGQQDEFGSWWEELQQRAKRGQDQYQQQQQQSRQRTSSSSSSSRSTSPMGAPRDPKGYYAALGLPTTATTQEIQAAFRGKALVVHPDRVAPERKAEATGKMQVLTEAYSVLRDPKKRKTYDLLGR